MTFPKAQKWNVTIIYFLYIIHFQVNFILKLSYVFLIYFNLIFYSRFELMHRNTDGIQ